MDNNKRAHDFLNKHTLNMHVVPETSFIYVCVQCALMLMILHKFSTHNNTWFNNSLLLNNGVLLRIH